MPTYGCLFILSIVLYFSKKIREGKKKGDVVRIFKNNKIFDKYVLQLSTEITFDSSIETTFVIYQIVAHIKLQKMLCSRYIKSILYPNSILYITYRWFKVFDALFSFY